MTEFTMVDFPRTYFGTKIMKTVVLINKSPVGVMYCSKVVIKTESVVRTPLFVSKDKSCNNHTNYKQLRVSSCMNLYNND